VFNIDEIKFAEKNNLKDQILCVDMNQEKHGDYFLLKEGMKNEYKELLHAIYLSEVKKIQPKE